MLQNAISDSRTITPLVTRKDNQGGVALEDQSKAKQKLIPSCLESQTNPCVQTVHMDDLYVIAPFKKAVIKIDIEGHEHKAFAHAVRLLKDIYVPFIFMEWMKLREYYGAEVRFLIFLKLHIAPMTKPGDDPM